MFRKVPCALNGFVSCCIVSTVTVAGYLMELVKKSSLDLQLGLVQTAYSNGSSTSYISKTLVRCVVQYVL